MKKKITALILTAILSLLSLSSCLLLDSDLLAGGLTSGGGEYNTTINVQGGPNYDSININSSSDGNLLAASKAMLSAVRVESYFEVPQYTMSGSYAGTTATASLGSGVIYKLDKERGDAYVITNYHVVYNAKTLDDSGISRDIRLYLYGMEGVTSDDQRYTIPATYVGGSMYYDIAVLKVSASDILMRSCARAVDFADSDSVTVLDTAIAIGNPVGGYLSATVGTVNIDSENINLQFETKSGSLTVKIRVLRTDAAVNSGNSGGGLFNSKGELIGIVNSKEAQTDVDNIGYAIPSNVVRAIADNAIYYSDGTVKRCMLGITVSAKELYTEYDVETGKIYKRERAVILEVSENSPIKDLVEVGMLINSITVDGVTKEVTRYFHVVDHMLDARVGSIVSINVTDASGLTRDIEIPITVEMRTNY